MGKDIKAIKYKVTTHHEAVVDNKEPWNNMPAYDSYEMRFCIVSTDTGEIIDDAQGYGYKTAQKAYAAYAYKTRDKSKDAERAAEKAHIIKWMKEHGAFISLMDGYAFDIAKGSMAPDDKFDAKFVSRLLKENNLHPDFTAGKLLKAWKEL